MMICPSPTIDLPIDDQLGIQFRVGFKREPLDNQFILAWEHLRI